LSDRIEVKQKKCQVAFTAVPVWLALFNLYWLTKAGDYRYALSKLNISHDFDAIIIVGENSQADPIYLNDRAKDMILPDRRGILAER
jgi:hypothetical protein